MNETLKSFERLLNIMDELREKCPWDREQTFESLRTLTIEETYELADAILKDDKQEIKKELGDVLLHIVFYAKLGSETGDFTIREVIDSLCDKLVFRHPHVFGDVNANDSKQVERNWEEIKLKEKKHTKKSVLDGVPGSLPAMVKAHRVQDKVRAVGFDWDEKEQIWDKIEEELNEFKEEVKNGDEEKREKEFGDMLFSLINAARLYDINPENALEKTNLKFIKRFLYLENHTRENSKNLKEMNLDEMNEIWEEAKKQD